MLSLSGNVVLLSRLHKPYHNIALGKSLSGAFTKKNPDLKSILLLAKSSPHVSIGRNQDCWSECKIDLMRQNGIDLIRRDTGGGACYVDEGVLLFSIVSRNLNTDFNFDFLTESLRKLDFADVKKSGRNDILIADRKISGSAFSLQQIDGDQITYVMRHHGTILHSVNKENLVGYLTPHKLKLSKHNIASVASRVCNLVDLQPKLSFGDLQKAIISGYSATHTDVKIYDLDEADIQSWFPKYSENVAMFTDIKHNLNDDRIYEYNFDITDSSNDLTKSRRSSILSEGSLFRIQFDVINKRLANVSVKTDSTNLEIVPELESCLDGHPYGSISFDSLRALDDPVLQTMSTIIEQLNQMLRDKPHNRVSENASEHKPH
jgi:lipoate-protein ligase A